MRESRSRWNELATVAVSSAMAGLVFWVIDVHSWPSVRRPAPMLVSAALSVAVGLAGGVVLAPIWILVRSFAMTRRRHVASLVPAAAMTFLAARQALGTLSGMSARATPATFAFVAGASVAVAGILAWGLSSATRSFVLRRAKSWWLVALLLAALSGGLIRLDRTTSSQTFERSYSFVESVAQIGLTLCFVVLVKSGPRRPWFERAVRACAVVGGVWLVTFAASRPLRRSVERSLPAVWEEPVYATRWLRRVRRLESLGGATPGVRRLAEKYELRVDDVVEDPWIAPVSERSSIGGPSAAPQVPWSIVVFFVDTLRADVAHDPAVMPETVAWMRDNLWFSHAYASGSSTLLTLAPMLGCRYDTTPAERPRLLDAARASGMKTELVIAKSASDYHRTFFPTFRFDYEDVVPDVDKVRVPTADAVVDRSLAWLRTERPERFLLWLYQFDIHSWGDLDEAYVEGHAKQAGFSKDDGLPWRYRAAARGVDQAFSRFRAGLEELGLAERTVILFVSDHGEALGQRSFWAHSTYLWESLLRVPLVLHVPGVSARAHHEPVSTVDVGTTLARFVGPSATDVTCHGEDLLARGGDAVPRRRPILFSAMVDGQLARVGMLGGAERKVVVDLRDSDARLLRIDDSAVEEDVSSAERETLTTHLGRLVRTPIFPRQ